MSKESIIIVSDGVKIFFESISAPIERQARIKIRLFCIILALLESCVVSPPQENIVCKIIVSFLAVILGQ